MLAKEIQKIYREYKELEIVCEVAQDAMIDDPENEELEVIADEAYEVYWNKREELVNILMIVTKSNRQTVNAMIASDKFENLMNKKIA